MKEAKQIKRKTEVWVLIFFFVFYTKCSNTEMASEDASDIFFKVYLYKPIQNPIWILYIEKEKPNIFSEISNCRNIQVIIKQNI